MEHVWGIAGYPRQEVAELEFSNALNRTEAVTARSAMRVSGVLEFR
jgi:hypothetical protein